jgi:hypothetical protein
MCKEPYRAQAAIIDVVGAGRGSGITNAQVLMVEGRNVARYGHPSRIWRRKGEGCVRMGMRAQLVEELQLFTFYQHIDSGRFILHYIVICLSINTSSHLIVFILTLF